MQKYDIQIVSLDNKSYEFDFDSGNEFFAALEQELIQKGAIRTHLVLTKSSTMIQLDFQIQGTVELLCDRSLEPFDEPIATEQTLFLKFADHAEELTDEIELIPWSTQQINVAHYIFEFVGLSLPMKKLHPRFRDEESNEDEEEENGRLVYQSGPTEPEENTDEPPVDPRWEALRKLNDN